MKTNILVVDLDSTLIHTDTLIESFFSALNTNLLNACRAVVTLFTGRAPLKRFLAETVQLDIVSLPYNLEVLDFVKQWKERGGKVVLATAADQSIANEISDHLGLFDIVYASDGLLNLKGKTKAKFLKQTFGDNKFTYIGDSLSDLHVWEHSEIVITASPSKYLIRKIKKHLPHKKVQTIHKPKAQIKDYARLIRLYQWLKNCLIFVPILAAHKLGIDTIIQASTAFVSFSLVASSIYILNDLTDLSSDRAHRVKRCRPLASGLIHPQLAIIIGATLAITGLALATHLGTATLLLLITYVITNVIYSTTIKRIVAADLVFLASMYLMRIWVGGVVTSTDISPWLFAFAAFLFFSLATTKRQAEIINSKDQKPTKIRGRGYLIDDLPTLATLAQTSGFSAILVMALYINSSEVALLYRTPEILWIICATLLFWISYTSIVCARGEFDEDPILFAAKDRYSQMCLIIVLIVYILGIVL